MKKTEVEKINIELKFNKEYIAEPCIMIVTFNGNEERYIRWADMENSRWNRERRGIIKQAIADLVDDFWEDKVQEEYQCYKGSHPDYFR